MQRIAILGSPGAGKSTLARALGQLLDLPVHHLDAAYWTSGWQPRDPAEFLAAADFLAAEPRWIIEGNYRATLPARLQRADLVILLDIPRALCLTRVILRWWQWRGRDRPDLAPGCPEQLDLAFLKWTWDYPSRAQHTAAALRTLRPDQRALRLASPHAVARLLQTLAHRSHP